MDVSAIPERTLDESDVVLAVNKYPCTVGSPKITIIHCSFELFIITLYVM